MIFKETYISRVFKAREQFIVTIVKVFIKQFII